jgi:hypothetical protein
MRFYGLPPIGQKQRRPMDGAQFNPLWVGKAGAVLKKNGGLIGLCFLLTKIFAESCYSIFWILAPSGMGTTNWLSGSGWFSFTLSTERVTRISSSGRVMTTDDGYLLPSKSW